MSDTTLQAGLRQLAAAYPEHRTLLVLAAVRLDDLAEAASLHRLESERLQAEVERLRHTLDITRSRLRLAQLAYDRTLEVWT